MEVRITDLEMKFKDKLRMLFSRNTTLILTNPKIYLEGKLVNKLEDGKPKS